MAKKPNQPVEEVPNGVLEEKEETNAQEVTDPVGAPIETPLLPEAVRPETHVMMYRSTTSYPDGPNIADVHKSMVEDYRLGGWMMLEEIPENERPEV